MATEQKRRLGRGLDALLGDYVGLQERGPAEPSHSAVQTVPLALIHRNPRNPRRDFPAAELEDLAASIRAHGIVQPIVVRQRRHEAETYEIIAGERRWRAAQMAGLHDVPVVILDVSDRQALELAIVENVQRSDLNPVEEARGYEALIDEFGYTQADLGTAIGKSRVHITNTLRLLRLPPSVLRRLETGELTAGHGRALITASDPERLAKLASDKGLSVREVERLAQKGSEPASVGRRPDKDADTRALERELAERLGVTVDLRHRSDGSGEIRIAYRTLEQLDLLCRKLQAP
ncbi:ParB/RepB/Spo0J family partition protein [Propylenella binzhouense]|uniref:ParB/RepB/Spo0J family partition protein n=1 Tax=Propylenella binzhouense TaxID=2555902 RepID=A0A964WSC5_9HYPH|nr:ParB/RepB/Spo0J family partition protein [Propylenella binzhouense]MYZ46834.1 ParB/RepB/Spo0J family partition protein [Propylenella binzhouense]